MAGLQDQLAGSCGISLPQNLNSLCSGVFPTIDLPGNAVGWESLWPGSLDDPGGHPGRPAALSGLLLWWEPQGNPDNTVIALRGQPQGLMRSCGFRNPLLSITTPVHHQPLNSLHLVWKYLSQTRSIFTASRWC